MMGFVLAQETHRKISIVLAQTIRKKTSVVVVFTLNNLSPKYKEAKRFKVEQRVLGLAPLNWKGIY